MSKSNCPSREVLAALLRNRLTPQQTQVLKQHVAVCPSCKTVLHHFFELAKAQQKGAAALTVPPARSRRLAVLAALGIIAAAVLAGGAWMVLRGRSGREVAGGTAELKPEVKPSPSPTGTRPTVAASTSPAAPPVAPAPSPAAVVPVAPPSPVTIPPVAAPPPPTASLPTTNQASIAGASDTPFVLAAGSQLGLVGRLSTTQDGHRTDAGVLLVYTPGKILSHAVVTQPISPVAEPLIQRKGIRILLGGLLHVPRDMDVAVWHAGGTPEDGDACLYLDGREIGVVGGNKPKNTAFRVPVTAGEHIVGWQLIGGQLGNSLVAFFDPESGAELVVYAPPGLLASLQRPLTQRQLDLNADAPMPKRPPNLLGPLATPSGAAIP